ncbi:ABC transporter permease [Cupriavidus basilensis]
MLDTNALPRQPWASAVRQAARLGLGAAAACSWSSAPRGSGFLSVDNLLNIGTQSTILLLIALPMTPLITATEEPGPVDGRRADAVRRGAGHGDGVHRIAVAALGAALLTGLAFGCSTVRWCRGWRSTLVATLGTLGAAQGLALVATDGQSCGGHRRHHPADLFRAIAGHSFPSGSPWRSTACSTGCCTAPASAPMCSALGGNRDAPWFSGVRINVCLIAVYVLGGLMAGVLAALLLTARMNAGHPTAAIGLGSMPSPRWR